MKKYNNIEYVYHTFNVYDYIIFILSIWRNEIDSKKVYIYEYVYHTFNVYDYIIFILYLVSIYV